jgi:prevent-host-death family protein
MKVTRFKKPATQRPQRQYGAAEFKARCLEVMDQVHRSREPVIVTKRGKPVVQIVPAGEDDRPLFGALKGMVLYMGDIISSTGEEWEAER